MHRIVTDLRTKEPVAGAWIDVWEASTNGLYEQQDKDQAECNLRGKFKTDANGRYAFYCLRPTPYPVPDDGRKFVLFKEALLTWCQVLAVNSCNCWTGIYSDQHIFI